jgi:hypothetical protein
LIINGFLLRTRAWLRMRCSPDLDPCGKCTEAFEVGSLRAPPRELRGTTALAMSKKLESQRRRDSVDGTWPGKGSQNSCPMESHFSS